MKTGTKIALWVAGIAVVSVGGYFIYKSMKKSREEKAEKELAEKLAKDMANKPKQKPLSIPSLGQQLFTDTTVNPFRYANDLLMFQNWVIYTKKDKAILGAAGVDGKWGKDTAAAWAKYKDEYNSLSKR
jgi:hypothetical protein